MGDIHHRAWPLRALPEPFPCLPLGHQFCEWSEVEGFSASSWKGRMSPPGTSLPPGGTVGLLFWKPYGDRELAFHSCIFSWQSSHFLTGVYSLKLIGKGSYFHDYVFSLKHKRKCSYAFSWFGDNQSSTTFLASLSHQSQRCVKLPPEFSHATSPGVVLSLEVQIVLPHFQSTQKIRDMVILVMEWRFCPDRVWVPIWRICFHRITTDCFKYHVVCACIFCLPLVVVTCSDRGLITSWGCSPVLRPFWLLEHTSLGWTKNLRMVAFTPGFWPSPGDLISPASSSLLHMRTPECLMTAQSSLLQ